MEPKEWRRTTLINELRPLPFSPQAITDFAGDSRKYDVLSVFQPLGELEWMDAILTPLSL